MPKPNQIAAQLYTCRDLLKTPADIATTLHRLRAAGYTAVQVSGMGPIAEEELRKILDGEGMVCCATHEPGQMILKEPGRVAERLSKLACRHTAYPCPKGVDLSSEDEVAGLIRDLDHAGSVLASKGMRLSYHNHSLEFRKLGGVTVLERIYAGTGAKHLLGELDTYWVQHGGGDNVAWIERLHGRLPLLHLKDYVVNQENQPAWCEVGTGNLDFPRIIKAAERAGCEWFIVEQDTCPGDPVDSLAQSYRYLVEKFAETA
jgi:sugar phosphate isomerase/epimerase